MPLPTPLAHPAGTNPDRPMFVITVQQDGPYRYRCWDTSASYIACEPASRDKVVSVFPQVMAMLLADQARLHVPETRRQHVIIEAPIFEE